MQPGVSQNNTGDKWLYFLIGLAVLTNFSGLFIPLMDPDASIYATISRHMAVSGNYTDLVHEGKDWLDKPHFQFWITAFSFKIFGVHDWSYKLPGILFVLIGAYYTYLFAKKYYSRQVGLWAAFFLLSGQHILLSDNDIRAEAYLTGLLIAAIYHFAVCLDDKKNKHLVIAVFFSACAVMTKGIFTLIPVAGAVAGNLILKKRWKDLFHIRWVFALILFTIFISPEIYSLWQQFDRHPEKIVFGETGVSGIRFFLWDSQFGRFFNTGPIKGKGDPTFFLHTLLWAFLPWSILMYMSLVHKFKNFKQQIAVETNEWYSLMGGLSALLIFSLSKFQLPYYTNIIFPLLAILTARYTWIKTPHSQSRLIRIILYGILSILLVAPTILHILYKPDGSFVIIAILIALAIFLLVVLPAIIKMEGLKKALFQTGAAVLIVNLYINLVFYPDLLKYQGSSEAAFYVNKNYPGENVVCRSTYDAAFEFYLQSNILHTGKNSNDLNYPGIWYVSAAELEELKNKPVSLEVLKEVPIFRITLLSLKFIDKKTRDTQLSKLYLIRVLPNSATQ
jgi:4-amino-4-deoxy-L-arabinose transferase-like glycosyltransferase